MLKKAKKKPADAARRRSAAPSDHEGAAGDDYDQDHDIDLQPIEVKRKPDDQVPDLTDTELNEVFTRTLDGGDPNVPKFSTMFSHETSEYVKVPETNHLKIHFFMEGELIEAGGQEARYQAERMEGDTAEKAEAGTLTEGGEEATEGTQETKEAIKNQFNFSERATQTFNNPMRKKVVVTEPARTCVLTEQVSAHAIHDTYLEDLERKILAASLEQKKKKGKGKEVKEEQGGEEEVELFESEAFGRSMKLMERMINNNAEAEDYKYYKYYEDKSEAKREDGKGSLIALWRFGYEPVQGKNVTSICWNPQYHDLYGVGFGSYDFLKQSNGMICVYTLKNTQFPEYCFQTETGVMTVDFNPDHPALLCCGMYDGSVAVFDLRKGSKSAPIFSSNSPDSKHTDPVWQVYWGKEQDGGPINFFSISSDGRVINWFLAKTQLQKENLVTLQLLNETESIDAGMDSTILGNAGGSCFDFNKNNEHLFVVGTEEGAIQLYSKQYNTKFLRNFDGHHMAIYSVKWNVFHPNVFLSCSADWTVKLWEANTNKAVMVFDLNTSVGDVAWSPFSSTVFATITSDGWVRVYDLAVNKHEAIGEHQIKYRGPKKAKLTNISFNPIEPVLCVGDDRGYVSVLKLSNNLRKMSAVSIDLIDREEEIAKLDRVMIMPDDEDKDDIAALLEAANKGETDVGSA